MAWNKANPDRVRELKSASDKRVRRKRAKDGDRCMVYSADRTTKRCPRCTNRVPVTELGAGKVYCRPCSTEVSRDWARSNPDKRHIWRKRNPEENREAMRRYRAQLRASNPELLVEQNRKEKLRRKGTTVEAYENLLSEQKGVCGICGFPPRDRSLAVDHDHNCCDGDQRITCGKCNRGLLCGPCNKLLSRLESQDDWIEKAMLYLQQYPRS